MKKKADVNVLQGNLKETNVVQKSKPLMLMRTVPFELGELKILDTYLSRINSHDENSRTVTFTKSEYETLMGLSDTRPQTLKKYIKSMLQKVVEVPTERGYTLFTLFTKAECEKNEYDQWEIELTCSEQAKELFFNIEQLGYFRYELKNILALTSKYSFLLYLYLLKERYRGDWTISLDELREQRLDLKNNETYKTFKYFKRDILDKAVAEINAKTDITYNYSTVKTGRRITGIRFQLIKEQRIELELPELDQLKLEEFVEKESSDSSEQYTSDRIELLAGACDNEFSQDEMSVIFALLSTKHLPPNELGIEIARYHYLAEKYAELNLQAKRRKISNRFNYLKKMIENDTKGV